MSVKRIFWGMLFIFLGILIALVKFRVINADFSWVYHLWSLIFVFLGALLLKVPKYVKLVIASLASLLVALMITAAFNFDIPGKFHFNWVDRRNCEGGAIATDSFVSDSLGKAYEFGKIVLSAAAGKYYLSDPCDLLYEIKTKKNSLDLDIVKTQRQDINSNMIELDISPNANTNSKFFADIKLNRNIIWDFNIEAGASSGEYDFTNYKAKNISLEAGAASIYMKLGSLLDTIKLNAETGASSVVIEIPNSSGCIINKESALSSFKVKDFIESEDNVFKTPNYDTAKAKIIIDFQGGVSNFEIKRY